MNCITKKLDLFLFTAYEWQRICQLLKIWQFWNQKRCYFQVICVCVCVCVRVCVCMLTWACRSTCGFQSLSYITTTSAVAKLIPKPPALVLRKKRNLSLPGALNSFIDAILSSWGVCPSNRQYWYPLHIA